MESSETPEAQLQVEAPTGRGNTNARTTATTWIILIGAGVLLVFIALGVMRDPTKKRKKASAKKSRDRNQNWSRFQINLVFPKSFTRS